MGTEFSPDVKMTPRQYRPSRTGEKAAQQPGKPGRKPQGLGGRQGESQGGREGGHRIGRPAPAALPQEAPPSDLGHVMLLAQHENMRRLGRQQAFGIWATLNGHARSLYQPGQVPFDVLEDM